MIRAPRRGRARRAATTIASAVLLVALSAAAAGAGPAKAAVGGEYTITGLPTGSYTLSFTAGSESGGNYQPQFYPGKSTLAEALPVSVTSPALVSGVNAALAPGGEISGRVTAAVGGAPLAGIFVCANKPSGEGGECAETNAGGEYTIAALASGPYRVSFSGFEGGFLTEFYNGKFSETEADPVTVTAPNNTTGINAEMHTPGARISGTVLEAEGEKKGIEGAAVCAFTETAEFYECATTSVGGSYTMAVPPGEYVVEFLAQTKGFEFQAWEKKSFAQEPTPVIVKPSETRSGINASLKKGATIEGTVIAAAGGKPVANDHVCVSPRTGSSGCTSTNELGKYKITGLESGEYTVEFSGSAVTGLEVQWYNEQPNLEKATKLKVTAPEPKSGIDGKLRMAGQIKGRVTAANEGGPLANISVCASGSCTQTNAAGEYALKGLAAGTYHVSFFPVEEAQNYLPQAFPEALKVEAEKTIPEINAALQPGGQISGVVSSTVSGATLGGIVVCASELGGEHITRCAKTSPGKEREQPPAEQPKSSPGPPPPPPPAVPNSSFTQAKAPSFNAKTGILTFTFTVVQAGTFQWALFFNNADVGFAAALGVGPNALGGVEPVASSAKRCKKGYIKRKGKCVRLLIPFASGSRAAGAGTAQISVKPNGKSLKALKAGRTLHVSGTFTFRSSLGGAAVSHSVSAVVRAPKKRTKKH